MNPRRLQRPTISSMSVSLDAGAVISGQNMEFATGGSRRIARSGIMENE